MYVKEIENLKWIFSSFTVIRCGRTTKSSLNDQTDNKNNNINKSATKPNCTHFQVSLQSTIVANAPLFSSVFLPYIYYSYKSFSKLPHLVTVFSQCSSRRSVCVFVFFLSFYFWCCKFGWLVGRLAYRLWSMYYLCAYASVLCLSWIYVCVVVVSFFICCNFDNSFACGVYRHKLFTTSAHSEF